MNKYYRTDMVVEAVQFKGQDIPGVYVNRTPGVVDIEVGPESNKYRVSPGEGLILVEPHMTALKGAVFLQMDDWLITYADGTRQKLHPATFSVHFAPMPVINGETSDGYHSFNELYAHRHALFAVLLYQFSGYAWRSHRTQDGRSTAGWFIAGLDLPEGQISYHMPIDPWWERLRWLPERERNTSYDGHTAQDVLERLWLLAQKPPLPGKLVREVDWSDHAR